MSSVKASLEKSIEAMGLTILLLWFSFLGACLVSQLYAIENATLREKTKNLEVKLKDRRSL